MEEQKSVMEEPSSLDKTMDRRKFTLATAMAMLAGVAITITEACGSSNNSPTSNPTPGPTPTPTPTPAGNGDKVGTISANHGHSAVITAARLAQGGNLDLDIRGTATHTHTVSLSANDLNEIAAGKAVAHESSTDSSHSHTVTFNG